MEYYHGIVGKDPVPDPILGSQLVLSHDWILEPFKETTTILTKWILFRGEKVFRLCLKYPRKSKKRLGFTKDNDPILIFLVNNLNKLGLRVQEVRYTNQVLDLEHSLMEERRLNKAEDTAGESLQLFTANLTEMPVEKCTFSFSIWIAGSVPLYSFHLSDRLAKEQFWSASLESQHHVDVEFVVKDKTFSAHKAVLAARSPVFAAEFSKEKPGKKDDHGLQHIIRIDDVDPASVEQFLYFLYTGEPIKSSLTNEQLLKLADRYQVMTLVYLCRAALKNIDAQQTMSCLCKINPYAADLHMQASVLDSIHIRQDKEAEIFHDIKTSVFHFPWKFFISQAMSPGRCHYPKSIIKYQNEQFFAPHFSGNLVSLTCLENPWIHLICANHRNFGFKVAKAYCSMDYKGASWMEMKPRRADDAEVFLFVVQGGYSLTTRSVSDPGYLYFRTEMTSTIGNYHHEMMDTSWTTQLWQAALDQQLTDVEIFVGPVKLEAHRVILSARSPVLAALLKNNDQVKSSIVIEENMDVDVVKHFLKFLYSGCLEISATNKLLLELAEMYKVETLMEICQLANCISPDATSELDESKIDIRNTPNAFKMYLEIVNHFLSFRKTGNLENWTPLPDGLWDSSADIEQMTALAEMYDVGAFNKICQLDRSVPLDLDEITTFLLAAL